MFPPLTDLLILQERDTKIYNTEQVLKNIPQEAAKLKKSLTQKLQNLESAKQAHLISQKDVQKLDLDRQVRKETILKLKTRQGETKKNEEYQMLAHEIIRYGKAIDDLETQELELMEVVDMRESERLHAHELFTKEKALVTEYSQQLVAKKNNAETNLKTLRAERLQLASKIDPDSLSLYERIIKARGVGAIVLVTTSGDCTGCNIKLPPATLHRVQAGNALMQCSECSRILYNA